jgi:hypothetical protein
VTSGPPSRIDIYAANADGPGTVPIATITSPTFVLPTEIATTL